VLIPFSRSVRTANLKASVGTVLFDESTKVSIKPTYSISISISKIGGQVDGGQDHPRQQVPHPVRHHPAAPQQVTVLVYIYVYMYMYMYVHMYMYIPHTPLLNPPPLYYLHLLHPLYATYHI
jgi:hypothetical protein